MALEPGAYDGLRVADFTHVVAGPFCTRMLADHGADVVKVESFVGDVMRRLPVPYAGDLSSAFAQYNCGKKSIAVDLKASEGRAIARRLCRWADVVIENFSAGTFADLVAGYDELSDENPLLVMCSLSSFGSFGPYSHLPGFGVVAEAYSGLMQLAADGDGVPTHFGTPLADMNAGVHAFGALGAALFRRERTGRGAWIDLSSFDALVSMIDEALAVHAFTGGEWSFPSYSRRHPNAVPSAIVRTGDGQHVTYGVPGDAYFRRLATAMRRPELADDERFATNAQRVVHQDEMYAIVERWAESFATADELVDTMVDNGLAAARVRSYTEIADDPHLVDRGTLAPMSFEGIGDVLIQTAPHRISGTTVAPAGPAPHLGEHTSSVLAELGSTAEEVADLIARDIVREPGVPT